MLTGEGTKVGQTRVFVVWFFASCVTGGILPVGRQVLSYYGSGNVTGVSSPRVGAVWLGGVRPFR